MTTIQNNRRTLSKRVTENMKSGKQYEDPLEALEWEALCSSDGSVGQGGRFRSPAEKNVQMKVSHSF
jgi:hypothetical protein